MGNLEGVVLTPLRVIPGMVGDVFHVIKSSDPSFSSFGEAYFSSVNQYATKGWKKHKLMTLNLVVPVGSIKFSMYDDRVGSRTFQQTQIEQLSTENYCRLTIPPGIWVAFTGMAEGLNMLLNVANILHDPAEADNLPLDNSVIPLTFV